MKFLEQLDVKINNSGTSTGSTNFDEAQQKIDSYSPVDGKLIGSVSVTSNEAYHKIIKTAQKFF